MSNKALQAVLEKAAPENREIVQAAIRDYEAAKNEQPDGWCIPLESMSSVAQETFIKMMDIIRHGGQVDVVARCDGKDYRWQCDGLKYARRIGL